jgi:hypothetical protein
LEDEDRQYQYEDRATDSLHRWVADNKGGEVDRRARTGSEFFPWEAENTETIPNLRCLMNRHPNTI